MYCRLWCHTAQLSIPGLLTELMSLFPARLHASWPPSTAAEVMHSDARLKAWVKHVLSGGQLSYGGHHKWLQSARGWQGSPGAAACWGITYWILSLALKRPGPYLNVFEEITHPVRNYYVPVWGTECLSQSLPLAYRTQNEVLCCWWLAKGDNGRMCWGIDVRNLDCATIESIRRAIQFMKPVVACT